MDVNLRQDMNTTQTPDDSLKLPQALRLRCYRHGESAANAGEATATPDGIPLTPLGHAQAERIASSLDRAPDLVIVSPFRRAMETAAPSLARFNGVRHEIWPVQEFTYLAPSRCAGTTVAQRRPWTSAYWDRCDPDSRDGDESESFSGFTQRVRDMMGRLEALHGAGLRSAMLFGHAQFILLLKLIVDEPAAAAIDMRRFRHLDLHEPIRNGEALDFCFDGSRWTLAD